jgi:hypothetical protein
MALSTPDADMQEIGCSSARPPYKTTIRFFGMTLLHSPFHNRDIHAGPIPAGMLADLAPDIRTSAADFTQLIERLLPAPLSVPSRRSHPQLHHDA